jgi:predicted nucleic acid-binding protein
LPTWKHDAACARGSTIKVVADIVYLDICALKRPFDDATADRVRREAEAVAAILDAVSAGSLSAARSPAHDFENDRNPREDRRLATALWLDSAIVRVGVTARVVARSRELVADGFAPLDAMHLACAEHAGARWFVTTDDRLLTKAQSKPARLRLDVLRPDQVPLGLEGRRA